MMRRHAAPAAAAIAIVVVAATVSAHTGGTLDGHGCHADRRKGDYHCHHDELRGLSFPSRRAMLEAVESGNLPEPVQREGFLSRWLSRDRDDDASAAPPPQSGRERGNETQPGASTRAEPENAPQVRRAPIPEPAASQPAPPSETRSSPAPPPGAAGPEAPAARSMPARRAAQTADTSPARAVESPRPAAHPGRSFEERLQILSDLYEKGLISRDEYDARRRAILDEI